VTRSPARLDLWVTGGGTREPLDAVRFLGNRSTGRMALEVIGAALDRGHRVRALLAEDVPAPAPHPGLALARFRTAGDLHDLLVADAEPGPDALVHAAAVADYAPEACAGKVPSGRAEWTLRLRPLPKLADAFRARHPESRLVLFKLETGISDDELFERARAAARRAGAAYVFANRLEEVGAEHRGWLLPLADGAPRRADSRAGAAVLILEALESSDG